jgi:hypothetical protein
MTACDEKNRLSVVNQGGIGSTGKTSTPPG